MRRRDIISSRLLLRVAASLIVSLLTAGPVSAIAKSPDDLDITVSTRPDTVSGGDVLVRIYVPSSVAINELVTLLNGQAVTSAFRPEGSGHSLVGLVEGLNFGENNLVARTVGQSNQTDRPAHQKLTNYPITGPIISGPHEQPSIA
jgi:hypothetical protein